MTESLTTTDAAFLDWGTFSLASATPNFDIQGNISGNATLLPGNIPFLGSGRSLVESSLGLTPGTIPDAVGINEAFAFTSPLPVLSDPAQFEDGDITLDLPLISGLYGFTPTTPIEDVLNSFNISIPTPAQLVLDVLEINDAEDAVGVLDDLLNVELNGTGTLISGTESTDFNVEYFNDTNSVVVNGFDPNVVSLGLEETSTVAAEGTFNVDLVLSQFLAYSQRLGIELPPTLSRGIALLEAFGIDEFTLASGSFDLEYTAIPVPDSL
jgi:hypothetical protein